MVLWFKMKSWVKLSNFKAINVPRCLSCWLMRVSPSRLSRFTVSKTLHPPPIPFFSQYQHLHLLTSRGPERAECRMPWSRSKEDRIEAFFFSPFGASCQLFWPTILDELIVGVLRL